MMFPSASKALAITETTLAVPVVTLVGLSEIESDETTPLNVMFTLFC